MIRGEWNRFWTSVKDCIFPMFCFGCKKEGVLMCESCIADLPQSGVFSCPVCNRSNGTGACCGVCAAASCLEKHIALFYYDVRLVALLIHALKYQYVESITTVLQRCHTVFFAREANLITAVDCIVPVPLHGRRRAERGFNQAELIAQGLSDTLNIPYAAALIRHRYTKQQTKLVRGQRTKNVCGAFALREKHTVRGAVILLVDDVFTTGATMQECAKVLKDAGADTVIGFSIARG